MQSAVKTLVFWLVIALSAVFLWRYSGTADSSPAAEISFSEFMRQVEQGNVADVTIAGTRAHGRFNAGKGAFRTRVPSNYPEMYTVLQQNKVEVSIADPEDGGWQNWLLSLAPVLLLIGLWLFMIRQMQSGKRAFPPRE